MARPKKEEQIEEVWLKPSDFTGVVHTAVTDRHELGFPNYRLVTLHIENGVVKKLTDVSDRFALEHAIVYLDARHAESFRSIAKEYPQEFGVKKGFTK